MSIIFSKCFPSSFSMKDNLGKKKTKKKHQGRERHQTKPIKPFMKIQKAL